VGSLLSALLRGQLFRTRVARCVLKKPQKARKKTSEKTMTGASRRGYKTIVRSKSGFKITEKSKKE